MSPKASREPGIGQEAMIGLEEIAPVPDVPGAAVSVYDRAVHLGQTLDDIGKARSLEGFRLATDPESHHRRPIEDRYGASLGKMKKGAERRHDALIRSAKWQFAFATGHITLKHSGLVSREEADQMAAEDFDNFMHDYFLDAHAERNRNKLRSRISATVDQHKQRSTDSV